MKNAILHACGALLILIFSTSLALAGTINVTGGGTLTYVDTYVQENCWVGGQVNYQNHVYGGLYTNAFSYKDTKGVVTNFSNTAQLTWVGSPGGASCPPPGWVGTGNIILPVGSDGTVTFQEVPGVDNVSAYLTPPPPPTVFGYLNPKYLIMGVTYAPPGGNAQSSATYADTNFVGNTSNITSSFSQNYTESVAVTGSWGSGCNSVGTATSLFGFSGGGCVTGTQSNAWTIASNSSKTVTTSKQTSLAIKTPGTPNIYSPVDHDYDIIWLWLNPVVTFTVPVTNTSTSGSITWTGYGYDYNDPLHEVDVWPVYVGYLNGGFKKKDGTPCYATDNTCDAQDAGALSRSWVTTQTFAPGQGPGITSADFPNILGADPFANNPGYLVTLKSGTSPLTTTDGRFTQAGVNGVAPQTIPYAQAPPNSTNGENEQYQNTYVQTSITGEGGSYTYQTGFGMEEKVGGTFFGLGVSYDFKQNWNFTWMNTWQNTVTNTTTQQQTLSITGPPCPALTAPCNPQYTEPHEFAAYEDNLYGTFMFWPNPYFSIGTITPSTATIDVGATATFTIPTAANAGYTGNLSFASVTGLPTGASYSFSPTTGAAGATSTLKVTTTASIAPGTYPLSVLVTDGSLNYYAYCTLGVATPGFSVAVLPGSQTITAGGSTSYTVTPSPINGFSGNVTLSTGSVPSGVSTVFMPNPVAVGSSSTLKITSQLTTAPGSYSLTVNGTSGSLQNTANPSPILIVNPGPTLSSIAVTPANSSIAQGSTLQYTATGTYSDGSTLNLTSSAAWSSTNPGVATIASGGLATGVASGSTAIDATSGAVTGNTSLVVTGNSPAVSLSNVSLTFATTVIGQTTAAKTVTLTNTGTGTLHITSVTVNGDYAISSNTCATQLAAGANCKVSVKFTPTAIGTRNGTLSFADDAPASPQTVSLTGTGTQVAFSATSLSFGTVKVGTTSAAQAITLTNVGTTSVTFTGFTFTGGSKGDYLITSNTCGATLAAGKNCTVSVAFKPTATGTRSATLNVADNGGGSPQTAALTGVGN